MTNPNHADATHGDPTRSRLAALALGALGVVYGDLGTSPIYAFREAIQATAQGGVNRAEVLGILSLILWALTLVVTIKYVLVIMRMDNKGEGGNLALMALAQHAIKKRPPFLLAIGIFGAAMFYGDAALTPAISVLSAVEGITVAAPNFSHHAILPISIVIIGALFAIQSFGTGRMGAWFGPIISLWFLVLGALGLLHLSSNLDVLNAFNPLYGIRFLAEHGAKSLAVLGLVFLTLTGAEALYADMGHFGRKAISTTWFSLVFPALALNYLGQGALVLSNPAAAASPFFMMAPDWFIWPFVLLTMAATLIASQSIISGAFSLTRQAIQLGLLPRLEIRFTNKEQEGQIYIPALNNMLLVTVLALVVSFESSKHLASAYGVSVTGAMLATTVLAFVVLRSQLGWSLPKVLMLIAPLVAIELVFLWANLLKILQGGWFPLLLSSGLMVLMQTWSRGRDILSIKMQQESMTMVGFLDQLRATPPLRVPGVAVYLTSEPDQVPMALLHNLKHNHVLHQKNLIVSVHTADTPYIDNHDRLRLVRMNDDFDHCALHYGFMEMPDVPKTLESYYQTADGRGLDLATTSFFLGKRTVLPSPQGGMPLWQDKLFVFLSRIANNPADFFKIPKENTVEIGSQIVV
ncbi:MAG: potassium transporter Kup [Alphaproteobacteria bacterium]|nr:potassium transporter Kup [Alphaproteobacteria bacterium]